MGSILDTRPELPRPLRHAERETLTAVLGFADFAGRDELWTQAGDAVVVGYCGCGCASVQLGVSSDAPRAPRHPARFRCTRSWSTSYVARSDGSLCTCLVRVDCG